MDSGIEQEAIMCAYCGDRVATENAHVISRCLFPQPMPENIQLKTVPSCHDCNHELSKDEGYIRDMLVVDIHAEYSLAAQAVLQGPVTRAARNNRSLIARTAASETRFEPMFSKSGIYIGHGYGIPVESERVIRAMSMMVRGLYYAIRNERLPRDCKFDVSRIDPFQLRSAIPDILRVKHNGPFTLGEGVFACWFIYGLEEPAVTQWLLLFYNSVGVIVSTEPPGFDWELH